MATMWQRIAATLGFTGIEEESQQLPSLLAEVNRARQEWIAAQRYFESVSEPDLVDHAIMVCKAAEQKYQYLLRLAKKEGLINEQLSIVSHNLSR